MSDNTTPHVGSAPPQPRLWTSSHGRQACVAHGMKPNDIYFADAERILRLRGLHGATVEVVGNRPPSPYFEREWRMAGFVPRYHDPDWRRDEGHCGRCSELAGE